MNKMISKIKKTFSNDYGSPIPTGYIDVLDGIRVMAIMIVVFFHFWQQSWWTFYWDFPADSFMNKYLGIDTISLEYLQRYGSFFVDLMILLSGFLLFLPYARHMVEGRKCPGLPDIRDTGNFYRKRLARIVPSYLFCFLIFLFVFILPEKDYQSIGDFFNDKSLWEQMTAHLTFTQTLSKETYWFGIFNGALWTVAIEMQFYFIFPVIGWLFRKRPMLTFIGMHIVGYWYIHIKTLTQSSSEIGLWMNQLPGFFGVYANGMMAALVFVALANIIKTRERYTGWLFTAVAITSLFCMRYILKGGPGSTNKDHWQVEIRFIMSCLFVLLIIGTAFSVKWFRMLFANKLTVFLAAISYNLYIWHATIAVKFKEWKIPYWESETGELPNIEGNKEWMHLYLPIIFFASIAFATLVTYLIEKPCAKLIMGQFGKKNKKKEQAALPKEGEEK